MYTKQMIYQEYIPKNNLSKYINKFWYVKVDLGYKREKILPFPNIHMIVNLGERYKYFMNYKNNDFVYFDSAFVSGLQSKYLVIENPPVANNIGIEFKPYGFKAFTFEPLSLITNKVLEAMSLFGEDSKDLRNKINGVEDIGSKFKIYEDFLLSQLNPVDDFTTIETIVSMIEENADVSLAEIAKATNYSKKHLIHICKEFTGLSIKALACIYKFQKVIKQIENELPKSWAELAVTTGYYDQAYFNKKFKDFTGFTPNEYIKLVKDNKYTNFIDIDKA